MPLYGTQEWMDELCQALNSDQDYAVAAKNYEGSMICVSLPEHGVCEEPLIQYFDPYHGKIREWAVLASPEDREADFVLTAKYGTWKKITSGRLDMLKAVLAGKLKVKGKMTEILKHTKASKGLMAVMSKVPTSYHDE